jgi:hypothetical protein
VLDTVCRELTQSIEQKVPKDQDLYIGLDINCKDSGAFVDKLICCVLYKELESQYQGRNIIFSSIVVLPETLNNYRKFFPKFLGYYFKEGRQKPNCFQLFTDSAILTEVNTEEAKTQVEALIYNQVLSYAQIRFLALDNNMADRGNRPAFNLSGVSLGGKEDCPKFNYGEEFSYWYDEYFDPLAKVLEIPNNPYGVNYLTLYLDSASKDKLNKANLALPNSHILANLNNTVNWCKANLIKDPSQAGYYITALNNTKQGQYETVSTYYGRIRTAMQKNCPDLSEVTKTAFFVGGLMPYIKEHIICTKDKPVELHDALSFAKDIETQYSNGNLVKPTPYVPTASVITPSLTATLPSTLPSPYSYAPIDTNNNNIPDVISNYMGNNIPNIPVNFPSYPYSNFSNRPNIPITNMPMTVPNFPTIPMNNENSNTSFVVNTNDPTSIARVLEPMMKTVNERKKAEDILNNLHNMMYGGAGGARGARGADFHRDNNGGYQSKRPRNNNPRDDRKDNNNNNSGNKWDSNRSCPFFSRGNCKYGDRCFMKHDVGNTGNENKSNQQRPPHQH